MTHHSLSADRSTIAKTCKADIQPCPNTPPPFFFQCAPCMFYKPVLGWFNTEYSTLLGLRCSYGQTYIVPAGIQAKISTGPTLVLMMKQKAIKFQRVSQPPGIQPSNLRQYVSYDLVRSGDCSFPLSKSDSRSPIIPSCLMMYDAS